MHLPKDFTKMKELSATSTLTGKNSHIHLVSFFNQLDLGIVQGFTDLLLKCEMQCIKRLSQMVKLVEEREEPIFLWFN